MIKFILLFCLSFLLSFSTYFAQHKYYAGDITEDMIWSDTVHVTGNINMKGSLTILPGTYVEFQGLYQLRIFKNIIAEGTSQDSIRFAPKYKETGWKGISFIDRYGISLNDSSKLSYCVIEYGKGSYEFWDPAQGGGIHIYNWQNITIKNSSVRNNSAAGYGGGIYCVGSNLITENCCISNNKAERGGGIYFEASPAIVKNSTILNNFAESGGGIYSYDSDYKCENNTIQGNQVKKSGAGIFSTGGNPQYTGNRFLSNSVDLSSGFDGLGGGLLCMSNAIIENNIFANNTGRDGGAICLYNYSNVSVLNNRIQKNKATVGGAIYMSSNNAEITGNYIFNNSASVAGGIYIYEGRPLLMQNLICNNSAVNNGGGVYIYFAAPVFISNTIANNSAPNGNGVFGSVGIDAKFYNTIITGPGTELYSPQIYQEGSNRKLVFFNCNIQGGRSEAGYTFLNGSDFDPVFTNPSAGAGTKYDGASADWTLKGNSLCIDAGTTDTAGLKIPLYDLAGNNRIKNTIDIGAYEYSAAIEYSPHITTRVITFFFEIIAAGQRSNSSFNIRNEGQGELRVSSVTAPDGFEVKLPADTVFKNSITDLIIKPGRDTTINVSFHPSAPGIYSGVISLKSNDADNDSLGVPVSGTASSDLIIRGNITQSARWAGKVYVYGNTTIQKGARITIAPGTTVLFSANSILNVQGALIAVGTQKDSIIFIHEKSSTDSWQGINIDNYGGFMSPADTTKFIYCRIEGASGTPAVDFGARAINITRFSSVIISKCNFLNNSMGAIYCRYSSSPLISENTFYSNNSSSNSVITCFSSSSPVIRNNTFDKNRASTITGVIHCLYSSSPLVSGNTFTTNFASYGAVIASQDTSNPYVVGNLMFNNNASKGGVAYCFRTSKMTLANNIMVNNIGYEGGVIYIDGSSYQDESFVTIINNTISNNRGKYCSVLKSIGGLASFAAINTIFYGNISDNGIQFSWYTQASPYIINCNVKGGLSSVESNGNYNSALYYLNNIDADPLFENAAGGSEISRRYALTSKSPCIDTGISDTLHLNIPAADFAGNNRFIGSSIDMGALEYQLPVSVKKDRSLPVKNDLVQNYPNPFNPSTLIRYSLKKESHVRLSVYNSIGVHVADLVNKVLPAGDYAEIYNAGNLASGIYYSTMTVQPMDGEETFRSVKKMMLIK